MYSDRRIFIKAVAAAGLVFGTAPAGAMSSLEEAATATDTTDLARPIVPIVSGSLYDEAFLAGLGAAATRHAIEVRPVMRLRGFETTTYARLDDAMRSGSAIRLVALMDDASAALAVDLARSAGARFLALQHHSVPAGSAGSEWARLLGTHLASSQQLTMPVSAVSGLSHVSFCCLI